MKKGQLKQKVTADYILDLYQESKLRTGKEAEKILNAVKMLSRHLNEWLVIPEDIKIRKKR